MTTAVHSSGAVAQRVHLSRWKLLYLIERGDLPAPSHSVPGRRLFTDVDVARIAEILEQRPELRRADRATGDNASVPHGD